MNSIPSTSLTLLARSLESLRPTGAQPAWAEVFGPVDNPDGIEWHPDLDTMIGVVAPTACEAIGVVGYGWAHGLAEGPPEARVVVDPRARRRVRVVCVMTRTADMAGYVRDHASVVVDEPPSAGRVPDCMRRCFGLATPPPEEPTDALLADIWLSNVLGVAQRSPAPLSWPAVARLHPVIEVAAAGGVTVAPPELHRIMEIEVAGAGGDTVAPPELHRIMEIEVAAAGGDTVAPPELHRIMEVGAKVWTWSYLAEQAASPGWLNDLLPAGAGGWMDEGILSRWLLDSVTGADRLVEMVVPLVDPAAATRLRTTLRQLGVLRTTPRGRRTDRPGPPPAEAAPPGA